MPGPAGAGRGSSRAGPTEHRSTLGCALLTGGDDQHFAARLPEVPNEVTKPVFVTADVREGRRLHEDAHTLGHQALPRPHRGDLRPRLNEGACRVPDRAQDHLAPAASPPDGPPGGHPWHCLCQARPRHRPRWRPRPRICRNDDDRRADQRAKGLFRVADRPAPHGSQGLVTTPTGGWARALDGAIASLAPRAALPRTF